MENTGNLLFGTAEVGAVVTGNLHSECVVTQTSAAAKEGKGWAKKPFTQITVPICLSKDSVRNAF